jgi:hypothetical protein
MNGEAQLLRDALREEDSRLERERCQSERQREAYQLRKHRKLAKPRPLTKKQRRAALVPVVRALARAASEPWATTHAGEALLLVFKSERDLNTSDVLWCRIGAHRFDTLTESLWFWQTPLTRYRINGVERFLREDNERGKLVVRTGDEGKPIVLSNKKAADHAGHVFRRVPGMRRVVGGVRSIGGAAKELLRRVIKDKDFGRVSHRDYDPLNCTDANLHHQISDDFDPAKSLWQSHGGRRVQTLVWHMDGMMPVDDGGPTLDDWE